MTFDPHYYQTLLDTSRDVGQIKAAVGTIRQDVRELVAAVARLGGRQEDAIKAHWFVKGSLDELTKKVAQISPQGPSRGPVEYTKECGCKSRGHWVAESSRDGPVEVWCNVPECNCHPKERWDDPDEPV